MHRSLLQALTTSHKETGRILASFRLFHTTCITEDREKKISAEKKEIKKPSSKVPPTKQTPAKLLKKNEDTNSDKKKVHVSEELKMAAEAAAKSFSRDWTRTAEELLSRLQSTQPSASPDEQEQENQQVNNLLSTMKVGRGFTQPAGSRSPMYRRTRDGSMEILPSSVVSNVTYRKRLSRLNENLPSLKNAPRLGIFNAEKIKSQVEEPKPAKDLWAQVDEENLRKIQAPLPRNHFEEMIQWTKEGKLWTFPIDNEADFHEERKYKFHDHIFLNQHLSKFPDKGPVRKFMELVTLGLSLNPYITVPEKLEHIRWYEKYFAEKQDILKGCIGELGVLKEEGKLA
ncbi:small ribosomal subunit protein mS31-like [Physella acuta]|uniref:small ribosomal subunit protein mS31-like n=1 Tax=Physella acuta TaxID=109671 RepID=UPI0027DB3FFC|nr:small ribosomal subunit protein mS31-like [Physella acuta]